jgi:hypothetical protein
LFRADIAAHHGDIHTGFRRHLTQADGAITLAQEQFTSRF